MSIYQKNKRLLQAHSTVFYKVVFFMVLCFMLLLYSTTSIADSISDSTVKNPRNPMEHFFHQSFNNLEEELENVVDEEKSGVFIMFNDKTCPWCEKMKATIMSQVVVQDYYRQHFRVLSIDISGDTLITDFKGNELSEKDFAVKSHRVRATPVVMFFDNKGNKVMRYTGIVRNVEEFLWLGEYVVDGAYKKVNFTKYKRNKKNQAKRPAQNKAS